MSRISLLLAALSLPACAADVLSTAEQQASDTQPYLAESRRCDPNLCILFTAQDSDHDGVADEDELAAGTDPNDPTKYPEMIDLAKLMAVHELPTWGVGNSLMVLLPTRDANGLPVFGGEASLPARKSGLETAGIKVPAGVDIGRGFTMSRTVDSNEMSFGQLFTAFGREDKGAMPVRLLADAIGASPSADWTMTSSKGELDGDGGAHGKLEGKRAGTGEDINGTWSMNGNTTTYSVWTGDGGFQQNVAVVNNADGSTTTTTTTKVRPINSEPGTWYSVTTTSTTSADHSTTVTTTDDERTVQCTDGVCVRTDAEHDTEDNDHGDASDHGYLDPEAAEHSGVVTANPTGMRTAIQKLQTTIRVVQNDNDPLSNYEVPPTGLNDHWGPVALYGGDPESMYALGAGFGITPAFVRVPRPEYDPNLSEQQPPMGVPPDRSGCLYCSQPPAGQ